MIDRYRVDPVAKISLPQNLDPSQGDDPCHRHQPTLIPRHGIGRVRSREIPGQFGLSQQLLEKRSTRSTGSMKSLRSLPLAGEPSWTDVRQCTQPRILSRWEDQDADSTLSGAGGLACRDRAQPAGAASGVYAEVRAARELTREGASALERRLADNPAMKLQESSSSSTTSVAPETRMPGSGRSITSCGWSGIGRSPKCSL